MRIIQNVIISVYIGVAGIWPARLADEIVHNRTVNLQGGLGHNIAMDRVCDKFMNCQFKGNN